MILRQEFLLNCEFDSRMDRVIMKRGNRARNRGRVRITMIVEEQSWKPTLEVRNFENGAEDFWDQWANSQTKKNLRREVIWNLEDGSKVEARCWQKMDWENDKDYAMRTLSELLWEDRWKKMDLIIRWYGMISLDYVFPYGAEPPANHTIIRE